jgi:hypothetical protein
MNDVAERPQTQTDGGGKKPPVIVITTGMDEGGGDDYKRNSTRILTYDYARY